MRALRRRRVHQCQCVDAAAPWSERPETMTGRRSRQSWHRLPQQNLPQPDIRQLHSTAKGELSEFPESEAFVRHEVRKVMAPEGPDRHAIAAQFAHELFRSATEMNSAMVMWAQKGYTRGLDPEILGRLPTRVADDRVPLEARCQVRRQAWVGREPEDRSGSLKAGSLMQSVAVQPTRDLLAPWEVERSD